MEKEQVRGLVEKYDENTALRIQEVVEKFRSLDGWVEHEESVYGMEVSEENQPEDQETLFSFSDEDKIRKFEIYDSGGRYEPWVWFANEYTGLSGNDPVLSFDTKTVRRRFTKKDKEFEKRKRVRMSADPEAKDPGDAPKPFVEEGILV